MSDRKSYKIEPDYGTTIDSVPDGFKIVQTAIEPYPKYDVLCANCHISALDHRYKGFLTRNFRKQPRSKIKWLRTARNPYGLSREPPQYRAKD